MKKTPPTWLPQLLMLLLCAAAPIGIAPPGGGPTNIWGGGSFASVALGASNLVNYSFTSEPTLGFGNRSADDFFIGTSTGDAGIDFYKSGAQVYTKINNVGTANVPYVTAYNDENSGMIMGTNTTPFQTTMNGTIVLSIGAQSGRNYMCFGDFVAGVPCITNSGNDLIMKEGDGTAFEATLDLNGWRIVTGNGTAAAPAYVWDNNNTGLYRVGEDDLGVSINGVLALDFSATDMTVASGYYLKLPAWNGAPTASLCDAAAEDGNMAYDYTNHKVYVCNEGSSTRAGWDYFDLTD
jgi:hypothetical protein